jgi:hypothetical protein
MTGLRALNDELERRTLELCHRLLPKGRERGDEYQDANSDNGGVIGDSLSVCIRGPKRGAWRWYGAPGAHGKSRAGGPLDLIELVKGMSRDQAIEWARDTFLAGSLDTSTATPDTGARKQNLTREEKRARNRARAREIYRIAAPVEDTIGETYLRVARGVGMLRYPSARFAVSLFHEWERRSFPAIVCPTVAVIPVPNDPLFGVWRIYLNHDGSDKAPVTGDNSPRMGLGDAWGRVIPLNPPADGVMRRVALMEGYETGLSCLKRWPKWTHLVCMFGSNIAEIAKRLPSTVTEIMHCVDHDYEHEHEGRRWRPGHEYAKATEAVCRDRGIGFVKLLPDREGTDFNDLDKAPA